VRSRHYFERLTGDLGSSTIIGKSWNCIAETQTTNKPSHCQPENIGRQYMVTGVVWTLGFVCSVTYQFSWMLVLFASSHVSFSGINSWEIFLVL
jgi:hypothetical protein